MKYTITLLTLILLVEDSRLFGKLKYLLDIESMQVCDNNEAAVNPIRNIKFVRFNRTNKYVSFDFTYDRPIDKNIGGSLTAERWGNGGWIRVPFVGFQNNICEFYLRNLRDLWVTFHEAAGVKNPDKCPVPAGNYSLMNYLPHINSPIRLWNGRFRFIVTYQDVRTKESIHCLKYVLTISELM